MKRQLQLAEDTAGTRHETGQRGNNNAHRQERHLLLTSLLGTSVLCSLLFEPIRLASGREFQYSIAASCDSLLTFPSTRI